MNDEYPLYPALSGEGEKEAVARLNGFVDEIKKKVSEMISTFYVKELPYIESDTWLNFRNEIMDGFKDYKNRKIQGEYDFKEIRQAIFKKYREELISDLNQDMVEEIESLKKRIENMQEVQSHRLGY